MLTAPDPIDPDTLAAHTPDTESGRTAFNIGGCASCHSAKGAEGDEKLVLEGGQRFETDFGTFVAPNISPDPDQGIGSWSEGDFVNAVMRGIAPDGSHYYPAFPYGSYVRMRIEDVRDLWAYIQTLPTASRPNEPNELGFPFSIRRGVGVWKLLYLDDAWIVDVPEALERGRYLVEGPGHCGECHTPRKGLGGLDASQWLAGAPNPDGKGTIPNITPGGKNLANWSEADISEYLRSGFTPDYDTAGGTMVGVIANTAKLSDQDRAAIAAYLKAIPAIPSPE